MSGPPGLSKTDARAQRPWNVRPGPDSSAPPGLSKTITPETQEDQKPCVMNDVGVENSFGDDAPASLQELMKRRRQREQAKTITGELKDILNKLTPKDAEIVKNALKSKDSKFVSTPPGLPRMEDNSLRSNLKKLGHVDSKRVIMVRKIRELGLDSPEILKAYFSQFGTVDKMYVTHSIDRKNFDHSDPDAKPIVRPACVGFIVMETAQDVANIFEQGLEHMVSNVRISLTAYEHHDPDTVIRNESKFGLPMDEIATKPNYPRFPTYANITEDNTLRANLKKLVEYDAERIFMVRKINKLGLGSAQLLTNYFSQVGSVTKVYVTHSIDRRKMDENPQARPLVRPAGIGFVVMDKADQVASAFEKGLEQDVCGVKIVLSPYEHHDAAEVAASALYLQKKSCTRA